MNFMLIRDNVSIYSNFQNYNITYHISNKDARETMTSTQIECVLLIDDWPRYDPVSLSSRISSNTRTPANQSERARLLAEHARVPLLRIDRYASLTHPHHHHHHYCQFTNGVLCSHVQRIGWKSKCDVDHMRMVNVRVTGATLLIGPCVWIINDQQNRGECSFSSTWVTAMLSQRLPLTPTSGREWPTPVSTHTYTHALWANVSINSCIRTGGDTWPTHACCWWSWHWHVDR